MPRRSRIALSCLCLLLTGFQGSADQRPPVGFLDKFVWRDRSDAFGGISAIEVMDGGQGFVAIGDKAIIVTGTFKRDGDGQIIGISAGEIRPLIGEPSGQPLTGKRADSEGLAIDETGKAFVSFENRPRVARLDLQSGIVSDMKAHPDFAAMPRNGALEALAVDADGAIYTVPEESQGKRVRVYRWRDEKWDAELSISKDDDFAPVGADILEGRLYLLERAFRGLGGFANRLRRFDISEAGLTNEQVLFQTPFALYDNLEGISVWRDGEGRLKATMISDDNFVWLQQTQIVEVMLPE